MRHLSNLKAISHWELVELAERLMSETPDAERFLPSYDAALAADNDSPLIHFCRRMLKVAVRRARAVSSEARAVANKQAASSRAA